MGGNELNLDSLSKNSGKVIRYTSEEVLSEIQRQKNDKRSWIKNTAILLITLFVFFRIGLIKNNPRSIIFLIGVLLIHEVGHWIGMRAFGYRNIQMFFIPLFGAAVSGESRNISAYKKAIVSLLGPVPGIILGCLFLIVYAVNDRSLFFQLSLLFLLINAFNLLPFFPLDGGRFLHEVLFCRNRYLELCFKVIAALSLIGIALLLKAWILLAFGILGLMTVHIPFKLASITHEIKELFVRHRSTENTETSLFLVDRKIIFQGIVDRIHERFPARLSLKHFADYAKMICDQIYTCPPKIGATVLLLCVYGFSLLFSVGTLVGATIITVAKTKNYSESRIVKYTKPDGTAGCKEDCYVLGNLMFEREVDTDNWLYHGSSRTYYQNGNIAMEGNWRNGKWHGEWKEFDLEGSLKSITVFDNGSFVSRKERKGGTWKEVGLADLPFVLRETYQMHKDEEPAGPAHTTDSE